MLCDDLEGWEAPVGGYIRTLLADSCCCTAETQHCTAIMLQFKKRVVLANHPHQKKETQDWDTRAKKNQCFMCEDSRRGDQQIPPLKKVKVMKVADCFTINPN